MMEYSRPDNIWLRNNISVPTDDFIKLLMMINSTMEFSTAKVLDWQNSYEASFAKIVTPWGPCYSFNIADAKDLFHLDKCVLSMNNFLLI